MDVVVVRGDVAGGEGGLDDVVEVGLGLACAGANGDDNV